MRAQGREQPRPDTGDPIEPGRTPEWPVGLAIRHDPLGERQTYPGQPRQVGGGGSIGVDSLGGAEGPQERPNAIPMGGRRARRKGGEQLHITRRLTRSGQPPAHTLADEPQGQQEQQCTTFRGGHARRVVGLACGGGIAPARAWAKNGGVYFSSRRTSATATSPTICRLAALTLSIVSSWVCQAG